jgi:hypothetical protein
MNSKELCAPSGERGIGLRRIVDALAKNGKESLQFRRIILILVRRNGAGARGGTHAERIQIKTVSVPQARMK